MIFASFHQGKEEIMFAFSLSFTNAFIGNPVFSCHCEAALAVAAISSLLFIL